MIKEKPKACQCFSRRTAADAAACLELALAKTPSGPCAEPWGTVISSHDGPFGDL